MSKDLAVVLVSGGMDSCVTAAIASQTCRLALLHVNYGQRTEARELRAFHEIADLLDAETRLVVNLDHLRIIGGSSLTNAKLDIPVSPSPPDAPAHSSVPSTYVPFRNAHLLAIAVSWAEVIGASRIFIGAVEEDSSGYPDCREVFYRAFNTAIELGTRPETHISIETPLIHMKKSAIVQTGISLKAPLHLSWSCYQNSDTACGICDSCVLRLKGFREAGAQDPLPYAAS